MAIADPFVAELEMEAATTRRVLERVPEAHLTWIRCGGRLQAAQAG
jgi:hypothetical protein